MKRLNLFAALAATAMLGSTLLTSPAQADEDKKPKNLKVLAKDSDPKVLGKAMKELSKGLGVKCTSCHVKGKFDSDDVAAKEDSRKFFTAVVGEKDKAKREAALKALLPALKIEKVKKAELVWAGVDKLKK